MNKATYNIGFGEDGFRFTDNRILRLSTNNPGGELEMSISRGTIQIKDNDSGLAGMDGKYLEANGGYLSMYWKYNQDGRLYEAPIKLNSISISSSESIKSVQISTQRGEAKTVYV
ncbi:hypothetical protein MJ904_17115 [Massilia sp. MB5]|uniref:hypothetical protein n=1 Tax=Massilia sp. MB5 TaxID=2919578 RepID=UPI001F0EA02E|nr:hypothetical protein [Massilia sp. MB5]UMR28832.1 hypothetical protein MJ904_17115 [Massilia sp. MB5]